MKGISPYDFNGLLREAGNGIITVIVNYFRCNTKMRNMSKYKVMNTEHLINETVSLCLEVPPELAQEIALRDDARES